MIDFNHLRTLARRSTELTKGRVPASSIDGWITAPTASHAPNAEHRARIPIQHVEVSPGKIVAKVHPDFEPEGLDAKGREDFRKFAEKPIVLEGERLEKHRAIAKEIAENTKDAEKKGDAERQAKALEPKATPEPKPASEPDYSEQWKKAAASIRRHYGGMVPSPTQWAGTLHHAGLPEHLGPEHSSEFEEIPGAPGSYQVKGSPYYTKPWEMGETEHAEARRRDPIREKHSELEQAVYAHSTDTPHHLSTAMSFLWDAAYRTGDRPAREAVDAVTTGARLIDEAKTDKQRKVLEKEQEERIAKLLPKAERYLKSDSWEGRKLAEHLRKYNETRTATEEATKALEAFRAAHPSLARPGNYQQMLEDTLKRKIAIGPEHAKRIARDYPEIAAKHKAHPDIVAHFEDEKRKEDAAKRLLEAAKPKHIADSTPEHLLDVWRPNFRRRTDGWVETSLGDKYFEDDNDSSITHEEKIGALRGVIAKAKAKDAKNPANVPEWMKSEFPEHAKALEKTLRVVGPENPKTTFAVKALTKVPPKLLQDLRDQGMNGVYVGSGRVGDMDDLGYLHEIKTVPEPWDPRTSFDEVGGVYSPKNNVAATSDISHNSGQEMAHTVLHELGHAIGRNHRLNDAQWLIDAHARLAAIPGKLNPYLQRTGAGDSSGRHELLAECFADILHSGVTIAGARYDRSLVRNILEHLEKFGGPKVPPKDRGDLLPEEFAEKYGAEIHENYMNEKIKKVKLAATARIAAMEHQIEYTKRQGYSKDDSAIDPSVHTMMAESEAEVRKQKREVAELVKKMREELTKESPEFQKELKHLRSHWGKLSDLETGVDALTPEAKETAKRWLNYRTQQTLDPDLAKRAEALLKKLT